MAIGPRIADKKPTPVDMVLNQILSNVTVLRLKSHNCHFNVEGPSFYSDHKTYEGLYEVTDGWIDTLGERIRALGFPVCMEPAVVLKEMVIKFDCVGTEADPMREMLLSDLVAVRSLVEGAYSVVDETTANILQELSRDLDKQAYFIRSSAQ